MPVEAALEGCSLGVPTFLVETSLLLLVMAAAVV